MLHSYYFSDTEFSSFYICALYQYLFSSILVPLITYDVTYHVTYDVITDFYSYAITKKKVSDVFNRYFCPQNSYKYQ